MAAERQEAQNVVSLPQARRDRLSPHDSMARLAALHDEAEQTAVLANLLGRIPYAAAMLAALALLTLFVAGNGSSLAETILWGLFAAGAAGAFVRVYANAIRTPFERATLRNFHEDAKAVALYAGFAWGAGAFLALPAAISPALLAVFASGVAAIMAAILRDRALILGFTVPAIALAGAAAVLRPLSAGTAGLGLVLASGAAVIVTAYVAGLLRQRSRSVPSLADLPLS